MIVPWIVESLLFSVLFGVVEIRDLMRVDFLIRRTRGSIDNEIVRLVHLR